MKKKLQQSPAATRRPAPDDGASHPVALVSSWGSNEESPLKEARCAPRRVRKAGLGAAAGRAASTTICSSADKKNPIRRCPRVVPAAGRRHLAFAEVLTWFWSGVRFDSPARRPGKDHLPMRICSRRMTRRRFIPISIQTGGAGTTPTPGRRGAFEPCF
jgi:hypothetical protein